MQSITAPTPLLPSSAPSPADGGFGVYIHWPFCQAKCPYCDFNSHVAAEIDESRWRRALCAEISRYGQETPGRIVRSVFFGGGTPSLMRADTVAAVLDAIRATWPLANDLEVTLEANPTSVEAGRFRGYRAAGVTRLSLGVQALEDADLRALGRRHSAAEARAALELARNTFGKVSFDLIYGRQHQTLATWMAELQEALELATDHLSLYQLTVEDGTVFADRRRRGGLRGLPDDGLGAALYEVTQEACAAAGLPAYEVSNHAQPGAESQHNLIYWRSGDWIGIGPGAHGRLTLNGRRWATEAHAAPAAWLQAVKARGSGEVGRNPLAAEERRDEMLMMGLRLTEGIDLRRLDELPPLDPNAVAELEDDGLLWRTPEQLGVTPQGRLLLNAVVRRLL